jgi:transposase
LTGAVFLQFLDEFLVPGLKPGQIVILDNAKAHNPIEMAWSKVKQFLRKAQARTVEVRLRGDCSGLTNSFSE